MRRETKVIDVLVKAPPLVIDRSVFQKTKKEKRELKLTKLHCNIAMRIENSNYTKKGYKWSLIARL